MSGSPPNDAGFPQIVGAAVLLGGLVALVDMWDRKAAALLAATMLLGVILTRDVGGQFGLLVDAISGKGQVGPPGVGPK